MPRGIPRLLDEQGEPLGEWDLLPASRAGHVPGDGTYNDRADWANLQVIRGPRRAGSPVYGVIERLAMDDAITFATRGDR